MLDQLTSVVITLTLYLAVNALRSGYYANVPLPFLATRLTLRWTHIDERLTVDWHSRCS